jgi:hypothetical protein
MEGFGMKDDDDTLCYRSELEAAVKAEREACAQVLDEMADQMIADMEPSTAINWVRNRAAAIRARGQA